MDLVAQTTSDNRSRWQEEELVQRILREFGQLQGTRGVWESHWQEIAERVWPGMSWKFSPYWQTTPGQKQTLYVYDSTATLSLGRFGAVMDSMITPRSSIWHGLAASDPALNKKREVREWFEEATRLLFHYRYLPTANFASQNQMVYKSLGAFGTGCLFIDQLYGSKGFRYKSVGLGEIYFVENHQGIVDKAFRYFEMTARQAIQRWGKKLPETFYAIADKDPETIFHFVHNVEPQKDWDPERRDFKGMPFISHYVCKEESILLETGGFRTFPYSVPRYEQFPGEVYGRSPIMDLLPAIKTLNEQKKTILKQGHRIVDPVLLAHDDGVLDAFSLRPGAINAGGVSADGRPLIHALPTGNLAIGRELLEDERNTIKDGTFVTLFQILEENPQMTATEVLEKVKEKGILLSPTMGNVQSQHGGSVIERELDLLSMQGELPPMPALLREARGEFKIVYDSPLNRDQRAQEAAGLMRTVENCISVATATQNPAILDHFDWDKIVPEVAEIQGVPLHWLKDKADIAASRGQRQAQQANQNAMQGAPGAAAMLNAVAKVHKTVNGTG